MAASYHPSGWERYSESRAGPRARGPARDSEYLRVRYSESRAARDSHATRKREIPSRVLVRAHAGR